MNPCAIPNCTGHFCAPFPFCARHWHMLPFGAIRGNIIREYHSGHRRKQHPTERYLAEVAIAVEVVKEKEARKR